MVWYKRYWNKFLNFAIPGRREKLLAEIMRMDQEAGLYEDWDEDHAHDIVLNNMLEDFTDEEIEDIVNGKHDYPISTKEMD